GLPDLRATSGHWYKLHALTHAGPQVIGIGVGDASVYDSSGLEHGVWGQEHRPIDLRRVPLGAPDRAILAHLINDHLNRPADLARQQSADHLLLAGHEPVPTILLHVLGHGLGERIGGSPFHGLVLEAANAHELGLG